MSDYGEWDFDADEQVFNLNVRIPMQICGDVQSGYRLIDLFMEELKTKLRQRWNSHIQDNRSTDE
jgi:hypothetical protein